MGQRIDVNHENIYYGDFLAVEDVNINIEPNKVTSFIGPSGCGKSTVLRTLDRMHEIIPGAHVEGEVLLEGKNLYDKDVDPVAVRRDVGMVFQRPNPFPTMSIRENVLAGVRLNNHHLAKSDADDLVEWALRGANLWEEVKDRLDNPGIGLSGGQQQRLCIARAVAVHPQVLLMDEPCSALDPISTLAVEDLINELKSDYTIVIVTHNMQQAARIADYTAFFNLKAVGQPGPPRVLRGHHHDVQQPAKRRSRALHLWKVRLIVSCAQRNDLCVGETAKPAARRAFAYSTRVLPSIIVLATERAGILCRTGRRLPASVDRRENGG